MPFQKLAPKSAAAKGDPAGVRIGAFCSTKAEPKRANAISLSIGFDLMEAIDDPDFVFIEAGTGADQGDIRITPAPDKRNGAFTVTLLKKTAVIRVPFEGLARIAKPQKAEVSRDGKVLIVSVPEELFLAAEPATARAADETRVVGGGTES